MSGVVSMVLYVAALVMLIGVGRKVWQYARTPAPLKIPTTPAPTTRTGVVMRMLREVVVFESLFKASKWTWIFAWTFHFGLLVALLVHLRFFTEPVWWWVVLIAPLSPYAGLAMGFGLLGLLARRCLVDRVRYISAPSDYLMLILLLAIAASGLSMRYLSRIDIVALKQYALGLVAFEFGPLPSGIVLLVHLFLVAVLLLIFPFSKLLHVPGLFFSPSRNQVDNSREQRHVTRWAKPDNQEQKRV